MTISTAAVEILRTAVDDARALRSPVLGQEHVLMAIGTRPSSSAGRLLTALRIDPVDTRRQLTAMISPGSSAGAGPQPTPRLLAALSEAEAEAGERGRTTTSADLVIGILRTHHGVGYQLLAMAGAILEPARAALDGVLGADEDEAVDPSASSLAQVVAPA